ncbi:sigma-70 family RNA polymerase sigma factor [Agarivorans sp. DSG3-1]|uniref:sigma-70 family RNA polymerase sigma factor n=1 Tax=Agarivorans sp. DSG3-1 TaxID=3342249 RepID=UPI00398E9B19
MNENAKLTEVVNLYSSWTRGVAKSLYIKYYASGVELEDYVQYATVGLIESAERFDRKQPVKFTSFAYLRVKGTILNNIYKYSEVGSLSHNIRRREKERLSSLKESAETTIEAYSSLVIELSIANLIEDKVEHLFSEEQNLEPYQNYENTQVLGLLKPLLIQLPYLQKQVMTLHYFHQLPFANIASVLNLSRARVSQLHVEALRVVRKKMEINKCYDC